MNIKMKMLLVVLLLSAQAHGVTFEYVMSQYKAENFEQAYKGFIELAGLGNARSQFNIGVMHARGEFVKANKVEAYAWVKLGGVSPDVNADKILSIIAKQLNEQEMEAADSRYKELLLEYGEGAIATKLLPSEAAGFTAGFQEARMSRKRAPKYPQREAQNDVSGLVDVQYSIGIDGTVRNITVLKSNSIHFSQSTVDAHKSWIYEPALVHGKPVEEFGKRMRITFNMHDAELAIHKASKIVEESKHAAEVGGGKEKYIHAYTLSMVRSSARRMEGFSKLNLDAENKWYSKSAQDGYPVAKFELGRRLSYGQQCAADLNKSYFWLESAANDMVVDAQLMLGMELYYGSRFKQDIPRGLALIKSAADADLPEAQLKYAWILSTSPNKDVVDTATAITYFEKVDKKAFIDKLTYYETMAVVYAGNGDFKVANQALKKAKKERKRYKLKPGLTEEIAKSISLEVPYIQKGV